MPSRAAVIDKMRLSGSRRATGAGACAPPSTRVSPRSAPDVLDRLTAHLRIVRMPQLRGLQWRGPTLSAALLCALVPAVWAQEAVIRGRVSDDRGEFLPTAAVEVAELGLGAYAGADGRYLLTLPAPRRSGQLVPPPLPL